MNKKDIKPIVFIANALPNVQEVIYHLFQIMKSLRTFHSKTTS